MRICLSSLRVLREISDTFDEAIPTKVQLTRQKNLQMRICCHLLVCTKKKFLTITSICGHNFLLRFLKIPLKRLLLFFEGIEIGDFVSGFYSAQAAIKMVDGTSYAEVDNLTVRQKATFQRINN